MNSRKNNLPAATLLLCSLAGSAHAFAPTNFYAPYDPNLRMPSIKDTTFSIGANIEYGATHNGQDWDSHTANILQLYSPTEAIIPMLMNPTPELIAHNPSTETLLQKWTFAGGCPNDDGIRGHVAFTGHFTQLDTTLWGGYNLPWDIGAGTFSLNAYIPLRKIDVDHVRFVDQTKSITSADFQIKQDVTDNLAANLMSLGNLNIGNASMSGIGDVVVMLNWQNHYEQDKEELKAVDLFAKVGLSMPTGQQKDADHVFSMPLGNDGAWGMPFGLGIRLEYNYTIQIGADVDFLFLFDKTKRRGLKTNENQTDFLLLNKGTATKDHGLTWKFNLYGQSNHFWRGFSAKTAYEYIKHDADRLSAKSDDFSYHVINTAQSLEEWNTHAFIFSLNYDFIHECKNNSIIPQASLFYKLPIAGKGVINPGTFGGQININF